MFSKSAEKGNVLRLTFTVLGSGTLVPHPERGAAGLAVSLETMAGPTVRLLFDTGSGTLYRAARAGMDWREFSHIFYSHYHPDHTLDLVSVLFAANYAPGAERDSPLQVYGPRGLQDFYDKVRAAWPSVTPKNYPLRLRELAPGEVVVGESGWKVETALMAHGDTGGLAYRVSCAAGSLVYSGDTEYCPTLTELARGANLLVCECSTDDYHPAPGHLSPSGVARIVNEAGVSRVLLTHVYAPLEPAELAARCAEMCRAQITPARDLETYEV